MDVFKNTLFGVWCLLFVHWPTLESPLWARQVSAVLHFMSCNKRAKTVDCAINLLGRLCCLHICSWIVSSPTNLAGSFLQRGSKEVLSFVKRIQLDQQNFLYWQLLIILTDELPMPWLKETYLNMEDLEDWQNW